MQLTRFASVGLLIGVIQAFTLSAQTFNTLAAFEGQGSYPYSAVVQAADGNFYGTTTEGGVNCAPYGCGGVFKMTPAGKLTLLYSFCAQAGCADGSYPFAPLVEAPDGDFFGTTKRGGAHSNGTIFKITKSGALTTLYSFCSQSACADGAGPEAGLVRSEEGDLYGTTYQGGAAQPQCDSGCGTVFKVTPTGTLTTLYSFCAISACADGAAPAAALTRARDGDFYGTTVSGGGTNFFGTAFKISAEGVLTTLHQFCSEGDGTCSDGGAPVGGVIQASDGYLYGTTAQGGTKTGGTIFTMTLTGTVTTLHSFCYEGYSSCTGGQMSEASLVQGTDGNLYGTTRSGGTDGAGTIFEITPAGAFITLYNLCNTEGCTSGEFPHAPLIQGADGNLYGTTYEGGAGGAGTVFSLTVSPTPQARVR